MNIETLVSDEIVKISEELKKHEPGTEVYDELFEARSALIDKLIEIKKLNNDQIFKADQLKGDKKDRLIKNILTCAGIIVPAGLTIWGTVVSLAFEDKHAVTSIMGRGFIQRMLPKNKG